MKKIKNLIFLLLCFSSISLFAQIPGLKQDFNDGKITGWLADHPRTFQLSAADSALKITYTRTASSEMWDNFNYTPPDLINPEIHPVITLKVKSNVYSQLTLKPIYSNGTNDWLQQYITSDNQWHNMQFNLVNYHGTTLRKIYLYLDGGSTTPKSGIVYFDDMVIGSESYVIKITDVQATVVDSSQVDLHWNSNYPGLIKYYNVYRSRTSGFTCDSNSFVDSTSQKTFSDSGLTANTIYYYKITAIDTAHVESSPSNQVRAYTAGSVNALWVGVQSVNKDTVGLYEKFEIAVDLLGAYYENPYDPKEIDVSATFISPSGKEWHIFAFYDNFRGRNAWKVRFSPNETGTWWYKLSARDSLDAAESDSFSFEAIESPYHGWIKASQKNRHYFQHDDGTSFYGVGVYYPWQVTTSGLSALEASGANLWGYWNIMYDDGTIIESLNSGLGKYDQNKCGRIDQLLDWSAERGLKMMLAIWPHDLLSNTVWVHQWHQNPYKEITDVKDFFENKEAWEYQKKQYRYLIARWGCYRSLGIWEIVNEITGTDAWQAGKTVQGLNWVKKVDDYFKENDPFDHPTTASQHGGRYWKDGYKEVDIPNVHLYETSWPRHYSNNALRSSVYIYHFISSKFWNDFDKPAFMGEAGYESSYGNYAFPSIGYTTMYHDALWTTWASGNASTPMWWDFTRRDIISDDILAQLKVFSNAVQQIDYVNNPVRPLTAAAAGCDIYALAGDSLAFGWIREAVGRSVSGKEITLSGVADTTYSIEFINTWEGTGYETIAGTSTDTVLRFSVPVLVDSAADVAFIIRVAGKDFTKVGNVQALQGTMQFALLPNYPNPFNPLTTIRYEIPQPEHVTISVFNTSGQLIETLVDTRRPAGKFAILWDGSGLASGLYFYRMHSGNFEMTQKCLLLK